MDPFAVLALAALALVAVAVLLRRRAGNPEHEIHDALTTALTKANRRARNRGDHVEIEHVDAPTVVLRAKLRGRGSDLPLELEADVRGGALPRAERPLRGLERDLPLDPATVATIAELPSDARYVSTGSRIAISYLSPLLLPPQRGVDVVAVIAGVPAFVRREIASELGADSADSADRVVVEGQPVEVRIDGEVRLRSSVGGVEPHPPKPIAAALADRSRADLLALASGIEGTIAADHTRTTIALPIISSPRTIARAVTLLARLASPHHAHGPWRSAQRPESDAAPRPSTRRAPAPTRDRLLDAEIVAALERIERLYEDGWVRDPDAIDDQSGVASPWTRDERSGHDAMDALVRRGPRIVPALQRAIETHPHLASFASRALEAIERAQTE